MIMIGLKFILAGLPPPDLNPSNIFVAVDSGGVCEGGGQARHHNGGRSEGEERPA